MDEPEAIPGRSHEADGGSRPGGAWTRIVFACGCLVVFAGAGAGLGSRWDSLVARLLRAPTASGSVTPSSLAPVIADGGERAVSEAKSRLEAGDAPGALAALDQVSPDQPAYPFAQRLRTQVENYPVEEGRP